MITKYVIMNKKGEYLHHRRASFTHDIHYAFLCNSELLIFDMRDRLHKDCEVLKIVFEPVKMVNMDDVRQLNDEPKILTN